MLIGLTGLIGAGKSTAARILESFGAVIIDADRVGRTVVDGSASVRRQLAAAFGEDVILPGGSLDRAKVAARAFVDDDSRQRLNEIVHPPLLAELRREKDHLQRINPVVVIDAALLLEWELDREMDCTLVLDAPEPVRFERLRTRGLSPKDILARQGLQLPHAEFISRASKVIVNDGTEDDLRRKLWDFWAEMMNNRE